MCVLCDCFTKADNCYRLSYYSYITKRMSSERRSLVENPYISMEILRKIKEIIDTAHIVLLSVIIL